MRVSPPTSSGRAIRPVGVAAVAVMLAAASVPAAGQGSGPPCDPKVALLHAVGVVRVLRDLRDIDLLPPLALDVPSLAPFVCLARTRDSLVALLAPLGITPAPQEPGTPGVAPPERLARLSRVSCPERSLCSYRFAITAPKARYRLTTRPRDLPSHDIADYVIDDISHFSDDLHETGGERGKLDIGPPECSLDDQRLNILYAALAFRTTFTGVTPTVDSSSVHLAACDARIVMSFRERALATKVVHAFRIRGAARPVLPLWALEGLACVTSTTCVVEGVWASSTSLVEFFEVEYDAVRGAWLAKSYRLQTRYFVD